MRALAAFVLFLLITVSSAEFVLEEVDVYIHDIQADGSATVSESIKLIVKTEESQSAYDRGFSMNDLAFWSTETGLSDVKQHVNPAKVEIDDLRVRPQPMKKCNPLQAICHGELLIEYTASPAYNTSGMAMPGSGIFTVEEYKPRTAKYTINPDALSFTTTPQGHILLGENVHLRIKMPDEATVLDLNPKPEGMEDTGLPAKISEAEWSDTILVKFSVIFEVEETLEKEVSAFFYGIFSSITGLLAGEYGGAIIAIILIIVGGYLYINIEKRKGVE